MRRIDRRGEYKSIGKEEEKRRDEERRGILEEEGI
jgi:hypothetical protein